jgi:hypothetical protein
MTSELDPSQEDAFLPVNEPAPAGEVASSEPAAPDNSASQNAEDSAVQDFSAAPTAPTSDIDIAADSFSESPLDADAPADFSSADAPTEVEAVDSASMPSVSDSSPGFKVSPLSESVSPVPPFTPPRYENGRRVISFRGMNSEAAADAPSVAKTQSENAAAPSAPSPATAPATRGAANPRLQRTAEGGPALARPIVLVSLHTDVINAAVGAALKAATERDTKTLNEIAEAKIDLAFFKYQAERRVLYR